MTDTELMRLALDEARAAAALGEVPVGAVVARHGEVVAAAHNTRETEKNATHHAELLAIDAACRALGGWRARSSWRRPPHCRYGGCWPSTRRSAGAGCRPKAA